MLPRVVPLPRQRGRQGHRRGRRRPRGRRRDGRRHAREDGAARHERGRARVRRRARSSPRTCCSRGDPTNSESFKTLISHINHERCGNAAMCIGAAQGALEYAVSYMNERTVGGQPDRRAPGPAVEGRRHGHPARRRAAAAAAGGAPGRAARHAARARDRDGEDRGQPRGQVRVRRGDPAARRLRLQPRVPGRARLPRHPRPVHRRRHGRDPAQLRRHRRSCAARTPASDGLALHNGCRAGSAPTYRHPHARRVPRRPAVRGTSRRSTRSSPRRRAARRCAPRRRLVGLDRATARRSRSGSPRWPVGCGTQACAGGRRRVAGPQLARGRAALPGVLAARRGRGPRAPPRGRGRRRAHAGRGVATGLAADHRRARHRGAAAAALRGRSPGHDLRGPSVATSPPCSSPRARPAGRRPCCTPSAGSRTRRR